jgi:hypothetical protein
VPADLGSFVNSERKIVALILFFWRHPALHLSIVTRYKIFIWLNDNCVYSRGRKQKLDENSADSSFSYNFSALGVQYEYVVKTL